MTVAALPRIDRRFHKPRYYHELTGKSVDWIRARIADKSLRAYNLSETGRADWYIDEADWEVFLATKANTAEPPPPKPKRRRRSADVVEFF